MNVTFISKEDEKQQFSNSNLKRILVREQEISRSNKTSDSSNRYTRSFTVISQDIHCYYDKN